MTGSMIFFWLTAVLLTFCVGALLVRPLLRASDTDDAASNPDVALYKAQLDEIGRDLDRGVIEPGQAEDARTEIARRLIAASKQSHDAMRSGPRRAAALATLAVLLAAGVGTYLWTGAPGVADQPLKTRLAMADDMRAARPGQDALEAAAPAPVTPEGVPEDHLANVQRLREVVPTQPDEAEGWALLAYHESQLGRFAAAADAQEQLLRLLGPEPPLEELARLLDMLAFAADGLVSPEAEAVAVRILDRAPDHAGARFWTGALYDQTGRPDLAFQLWRPLVEEGADGFHQSLARSQIELAAARAGINYALPDERGPSVEQMQAAESMSAEDRAAMIEGMVAGLSDRLATEGGPATDWARLITSLAILGETGRARAIWEEAQQVFARDGRAMMILEDAAREAGVYE